MSKISKTITVKNKLDYYKNHPEIINPMLPVKLTPKELDIMAGFLELDNDARYDRFGPQAKKVVRNQTGISHSGMSNYIKSLIDKGFLVQNEVGVLRIRKILVPSEGNQSYEFKLRYGLQ